MQERWFKLALPCILSAGSPRTHQRLDSQYRVINVDTEPRVSVYPVLCSRLLSIAKTPDSCPSQISGFSAMNPCDRQADKSAVAVAASASASALISFAYVFNNSLALGCVIHA